MCKSSGLLQLSDQYRCWNEKLVFLSSLSRGEQPLPAAIPHTPTLPVSFPPLALGMQSSSLYDRIHGPGIVDSVLWFLLSLC